MNARTSKWLDVGKLVDIPARGARRVYPSGTTIALFRTATDQVFALEDPCPPSSGPLSQGIVHDDCVTCPLHDRVVSLRDGSARGADEGQTRGFPVRLEERRLQLGFNG